MKEVVNIDFDTDVDETMVSDDEQGECCEEQTAMVALDVEQADADAETVEAIASVSLNTATKKKRRRRLFGRGGRVRMGAASWWTECKNIEIETSSCAFLMGYLALSFVLMTLMFNMREIVGDYCLGSKELKQEEYRENLEKAMELRRRSPYSVDEENRFEKELAANLYYDGQGKAAGSSEYFQNHRVPIILREDEDEVSADEVDP